MLAKGGTDDQFPTEERRTTMLAVLHLRMETSLLAVLQMNKKNHCSQLEGPLLATGEADVVLKGRGTIARNRRS